MENISDKTAFVIGTIFTVAIIGSLICGILECFGVSTGVVGGVLGAVIVLPLVIYFVYAIYCWLTK